MKASSQGLAINRPAGEAISFVVKRENPDMAGIIIGFCRFFPAKCIDQVICESHCFLLDEVDPTGKNHLFVRFGLDPSVHMSHIARPDKQIALDALCR